MTRTKRLVVGDWMSAPLLSVPVDAGMAALAECMAEHRVRHVPLLREDGRCAGVVSDMDVWSAGTLVDDGVWVERQTVSPSDLARPLGDILHPADEVGFALDLLLKTGKDHALVLQDDGAPVGIFTEHDVVRIAARHAPEWAGSAQTHRPFTVDERLEVSDALTEMVARGIRHLVVLREGQLYGVASVRDLMAADGALTVGDVVPGGLVHTVPPSATLRHIAWEMKRLRIGSVLILEGERVTAIVTRTDVLKTLRFLLQTDQDTDPQVGLVPR